MQSRDIHSLYRARMRIVKDEMARLDQAIRAYEAKAMNPANPVVKESGAVRRASMDLTRALAELRKPG